VYQKPEGVPGQGLVYSSNEQGEKLRQFQVKVNFIYIFISDQLFQPIIDWSYKDSHKLISKMEVTCPSNENFKFDTRIRKIESKVFQEQLRHYKIMEEVLSEFFMMAREIMAKLSMNDEKGISVPAKEPHFTFFQYLLGHFGRKRPGLSLTVYLLSK
jgi:hypothetical protein